MEWVENLSGVNDVYNTNRSQFWQVVKRVSKDFYNTEGWYKHVAWTNLYKVSPESWNPKESLKKIQFSSSSKILKKEIEVLNPGFVVFLTSGWEEPFLLSFGIDGKSEHVVKWGKYESRSFTVGNRTYIVSPHPMGKKIGEHVEAIIKILRGEIS